MATRRWLALALAGVAVVWWGGLRLAPSAPRPPSDSRSVDAWLADGPAAPLLDSGPEEPLAPHWLPDGRPAVFVLQGSRFEERVLSYGDVVAAVSLPVPLARRPGAARVRLSPDRERLLIWGPREPGEQPCYGWYVYAWPSAQLLACLPEEESPLPPSPDGRRLARRTAAGWSVVDVVTRQEVATLPTASTDASGRQPCWDPVTNLLICAELDGRTSQWATASPDGRLLAVGCGESGGLVLVERASGRALHRLCADCTVSGAAFSRDGRWLMLGLGRGQGLRVWSVTAAEMVHTEDHGLANWLVPEGSLSLSPDGVKLLVVSDSDWHYRLAGPSLVRLTTPAHAFQRSGVFPLELHGVTWTPAGPVLSLARAQRRCRQVYVPGIDELPQRLDRWDGLLSPNGPAWARPGAARPLPAVVAAKLRLPLPRWDPELPAYLEPSGPWLLTCDRDEVIHLLQRDATGQRWELQLSLWINTPDDAVAWTPQHEVFRTDRAPCRLSWVRPQSDGRPPETRRADLSPRARHWPELHDWFLDRLRHPR